MFRIHLSMHRLPQISLATLALLRILEHSCAFFLKSFMVGVRGDFRVRIVPLVQHFLKRLILSHKRLQNGD